jgi:hypothetical protein
VTQPSSNAEKKTPEQLRAVASPLQPDAANETARSLTILASRLQALLESARHLSAGESAVTLGIPARQQWRGDVEEVLTAFTGRMRAASRIPSLQNSFSRPWTEHACAVLPSSSDGNGAQWATIIAWAAIHALGELQDERNSAQAATNLFDSFRLREPLAESLAQFGLEGDERWRAAARVRVIFANEPWLPGAKRSARSPYSWLHDHDVAWLINVHEHQSVRYFNKEQYECLLWWMALPALVSIAEAKTFDHKALQHLEEQIRARIDAAEAVGYQVMALFELGEGKPDGKLPLPISGDEPPLVEDEQGEPVKKTTT